MKSSVTMRIRLQAGGFYCSMLQVLAFSPIVQIVALTTVTVAQAQTQSVETVARIAEAITVRIEGATQGSGVLVKREGNRYTVLTAWHVVSGQRQGEELAIYTPDGKAHQAVDGSIQQIGKVDMAILSFSSSTAYKLAKVGDAMGITSGSSIFVGGYPLPTSAVPKRIWRFLTGNLVAKASVAMPNGYQLLYSNPTLPGMSGGAVLNQSGELIGIHGQAETDSQMSDYSNIAVKTGTNQAVPISYYKVLESQAVFRPPMGHLLDSEKRKGSLENPAFQILHSPADKKTRNMLTNGRQVTAPVGRTTVIKSPSCELRQSLGYKC
jgi:S1-C subfamily serine protease